MNMFGVSAQNNPRKCQNGDPQFVKILKKWGFHKKDELFTFSEFFTKKYLFSQSISLDDANSEK